MTKSTITREQVQKIIVAADEVITALDGTNEYVHPDDSKKMCELWDHLNDRHAPPVVVRGLARLALAAMDSVPVAWTEQCEITNMQATGLYLRGFPDSSNGRDIPLYTSPPPASVNEFIPKDLDKALGVLGMALPESEEEFNLQTERWIQRLINRVIRYSGEFPLQSASVVPEEITNRIGGLDWGWEGEFNRGWNACRAAMLQNVTLTNEGDMQAGNSPVIPDGYVLVPVEPTAEMVKKMRYHVGGYDRNIKEGYKAMLAAAAQEVNP